MSHIVSYFVTRTVTDKLPASDFKSINKSAENLFRCGHVQAIQIATSADLVYLKANCIPEMRKDRLYSMKMIISTNSYDVLNAECGCPAGKGPNCSCKHIGAFSYALSDFCRVGSVPDFLTCTDQLQQWNRPRGRKVDPAPVDRLGDRRRELLPSKIRLKGSQMIYDPRPSHLRVADPQALEDLRCNLLQINKPCGYLNVILPSLKKIQHDHCYYAIESQPITMMHDAADEVILDNSIIPVPCIPPALKTAEVVIEQLCISSDQRILELLN